jgi:hypothetical protein
LVVPPVGIDEVEKHLDKDEEKLSSSSLSIVMFLFLLSKPYWRNKCRRVV